MKSKIYTEVLRTQIEKSLVLLSNHFSTESSIVKYTLSENDQLFDKTEEGKTIPVYGLMIELDTVVDGKPVNKKLYYRRYENRGSLNDIKATAFSELNDLMVGTFLIQATNTSSDILEKLSKTREIK